jgi:DNA-binding response OmpR family regulator
VRVLVIADGSSRPDIDGESAAAVLRDLGCAVELSPFDLEGLDEERLEKRPPAIVIVDAGDRAERGAACVKRLRKIAALSETPILLTATAERLGAIDFGAGSDDFILRPLVPAELYARLRQLDWRYSAFSGEERIKIDDLVIDTAGYQAHLRGRPLPLTHKEFELLRFLAQNRGRVFTRDQLLAKLWGVSYYGGTRTVDIHVRRVRQKLGPLADLVQTVRSVGYKMRAAGEELADANESDAADGPLDPHDPRDDDDEGREADEDTIDEPLREGAD